MAAKEESSTHIRYINYKIRANPISSVHTSMYKRFGQKWNISMRDYFRILITVT